MKIEWSDAALADLDRFVEFLNQQHPSLAARVAAEIISKVEVLSEHLVSADLSPVARNIAKSSCRFSAPLTSFNTVLTASALSCCGFIMPARPATDMTSHIGLG